MSTEGAGACFTAKYWYLWYFLAKKNIKKWREAPLWEPLGGTRSVILEHPKERLGGLQHICGMEHF